MFERIKQTFAKPESAVLPINNVGAKKADSKREEELDRRESVLNARLAAFESALRLRAEEEEAAEKSAAANPNAGEINEKIVELNSIAEALEAREKKLAAMAANLRERESELTRRSQTLNDKEKELEQKREEARLFGARLLTLQKELDEKERLFEERSLKTLETIRRQTNQLQALRKAA